MPNVDITVVLRDGLFYYSFACFLDPSTPKEVAGFFLFFATLVFLVLDERLYHPQSSGPAPVDEPTSHQMEADLDLRIGEVKQKELCEQLLCAQESALERVSLFFFGRPELKGLLRATLMPSQVVTVLVALEDHRVIPQPMPVQLRSQGGTFQVRFNLMPQDQGHCLNYSAVNLKGRTLEGRVLMDLLYFLPGMDNNFSGHLPVIDDVYYQFIAGNK